MQLRAFQPSARLFRNSGTKKDGSVPTLLSETWNARQTAPSLKTTLCGTQAAAGRSLERRLPTPCCNDVRGVRGRNTLTCQISSLQLHLSSPKFIRQSLPRRAVGDASCCDHTDDVGHGSS